MYNENAIIIKQKVTLVKVNFDITWVITWGQVLTYDISFIMNLARSNF